LLPCIFLLSEYLNFIRKVDKLLWQCRHFPRISRLKEETKPLEDDNLNLIYATPEVIHQCETEGDASMIHSNLSRGRNLDVLSLTKQYLDRRTLEHKLRSGSRLLINNFSYQDGSKRSVKASVVWLITTESHNDTDTNKLAEQCSKKSSSLPKGYSQEHFNRLVAENTLVRFEACLNILPPILLFIFSS
jgi:hypothetical protein